MKHLSPILPVAVMAFAIVAFLLAVDFSLETFENGGYRKQGKTNSNLVACTMDAKLCPDGSAVGRSGPKCEFTLCPGEQNIDSFDECVAAGYPVMESYPRQCAANRRTFTETVTNTNSSVPTNAIMTPVETLAVSSNIWYWQNDQVYSMELRSGVATKQFALPVTDDMIAFAYHEGSGAVARVVRNGNTDTIQYLATRTATPVTIDTLVRAGSDPVQQAARVVSVAFVTPDVITTEIGMWEGCADRFYNIRTQQKIADEWCGALARNPDGSRYVLSTAIGIATGQSFQTATDYAGPFVDLDWTSMTGDVDLVYDAEVKDLKAGFSGSFFMTNDEVLSVIDGAESDYTLASVNLATRKITELRSVPSFRNPVAVGEQILLTADASIGMFDRKTQAWQSWPLPTDWTVGDATDVRVVDTTSDVAIFLVMTDYRNDQYQRQTLIAFDPKTGSYRTIGSAKELFLSK